MKLLVSACLLGLCTKYDGTHNASQAVLKLAENHDLVPVCPEQLGGLPTPRVPCEQRGAEVYDIHGNLKTAEFALGAEEALKCFQLSKCQAAVLKARSPSCGKGPVYDGSFTRTLTPRPGVFAQKLFALGIPIYDETETENL